MIQDTKHPHPHWTNQETTDKTSFRTYDRAPSFQQAENPHTTKKMVVKSSNHQIKRQQKPETSDASDNAPLPLYTRAWCVLDQGGQDAVAAAEIRALLVKPHPYPDQKRRERRHILQGQLAEQWQRVAGRSRDGDGGGGRG